MPIDSWSWVPDRNLFSDAHMTLLAHQRAGVACNGDLMVLDPYAVLERDLRKALNMGGEYRVELIISTPDEWRNDLLTVRRSFVAFPNGLYGHEYRFNSQPETGFNRVDFSLTFDPSENLHRLERMLYPNNNSDKAIGRVGIQRNRGLYEPYISIEDPSRKENGQTTTATFVSQNGLNEGVNPTLFLLQAQDDRWRIEFPEVDFLQLLTPTHPFYHRIAGALGQ